MADTFLPIVKSVIAKLKADATIISLVGGDVFTDVPQETTFPYIRVSALSAPYDTATGTGMEHHLNVQGFSRAPTTQEAAAIRAAVYNVLHRNESGLNPLDAGTLININYTGVGFVTQEPDGVTWQSLAQFRAVVMD